MLQTPVKILQNYVSYRREAKVRLLQLISFKSVSWRQITINGDRFGCLSREYNCRIEWLKHWAGSLHQSQSTTSNRSPQVSYLGAILFPYTLKALWKRLLSMQPHELRD